MDLTATAPIQPASVERTPAPAVVPLPPRDPAGGPQAPPRVVYLATQGDGSGDEARIAALLDPLQPMRVPFDRAHRTRSSAALLWRLLRSRPDVVVMEGTGVGGGVATLAARVLAGVPFVVSSGDAVGPYLGHISPWLAVPGRLYERSLCMLSAGYIGWSPYLVGRALTLGARRGMTAAHWSSQLPTAEECQGMRSSARRQLGIPQDALVVGLVGSLKWAPRRAYSYGLELVRAVRRTSRQDLRILIVGDGDGRRQLELLAGDELGVRILMPGAVARDHVVNMVCAMDVASLPQSLDQVGALRYTTKLSEYLAAGVPVVTGQLPLAYDLDDGWLWRLEGSAPWDPRYVAAMADFLATLDREDVAARRARIPRQPPTFEFRRQQRAVSAFVIEAARAARAEHGCRQNKERR